MAYPDLKYRSRVTTSINNEILEAFNELAEEFQRPKSWLMDEALRDLCKKYGKEIKPSPPKK